MGTAAMLLNWKLALGAFLRLELVFHQVVGLGIHFIEFLA